MRNYKNGRVETASSARCRVSIGRMPARYETAGPVGPTVAV